MNAAETIAAAIEKLEALKVQPVVYVKFSAEPASEEAAWFGRAEEKLAIFNRSIDALIRVLKLDLALQKAGRIHSLPALDLARAIVGEVTPDAS